MKQFFGKYRGKVENNLDPLQQGRLQVSCPAVLGHGRLSWAMPCVPYAGPGVGFFAIPPIGAKVWVEFEGGDPDYPIWSGCFWGQGEAPARPAGPPLKVWHSQSVKLTLDDTPGAGGFTLEVLPPAVGVPIRLVCDAKGIELSTGVASVKLMPVSAPASVSVNNGALEVL
jgi:hypothetical protein